MHSDQFLKSPSIRPAASEIPRFSQPAVSLSINQRIPQARANQFYKLILTLDPKVRSDLLRASRPSLNGQVMFGPWLPALHVDGLKYVVGASGAEFAASDKRPRGFARNVVSFEGKVFAVTAMSVRAKDLSGEYALRGFFVVPRSVCEIFAQMALFPQRSATGLSTCGNLKAVAFESQPCLRKLESRAFAACPGLMSISVPNSVREIGFNCFLRCTNLVGAWLEGGSLEEVGGYAFAECSNLCSLGLGAETPLRAIPPGLCFGCGLRWVLIPGSVAAIGTAAFYDCVSLSEVSFGQPSKLTTIGRSAFAGCASLQRLHIVASVSAIGEGLVKRSGVCEMTVESGNGHFRIVEDFLMGGDSVVQYFGFGREVVVPSHLTVLRPGSFSHQKALEMVSFEGGSQLRLIERGAFYSCDSLLSIRLPASLEVIEDEVFFLCHSLSEVTFGQPSKLSFIGAFAFLGCASLHQLHIVASVSGIEEALVACSAVCEITVDSGNRHFRIEEDFVMGGDSVVEYFGWVREVVVPSHVTVLRNRSFSERKALEVEIGRAHV
jgi:hypothetical protein